MSGNNCPSSDVLKQYPVFLPEVEIAKFQALIQFQDFEGFKDYWDSFSIENKLRITNEIRYLRTGTGYTSQGENVLETIALYSCILGTKNGRLFFKNNVNGGGSGSIPEYEVYLQERLDETRRYINTNSNNKKALELTLSQALQILGLAMDKLFFYVNKPESNEFVRTTKNQFYKWLGKFEDLLTRNIMLVNPENIEVIEEVIFAIQAQKSVITINFIVYDDGTNEIKKRTISRAMDILNRKKQDEPRYYQYIAEANLELSFAKNACATKIDSPERREIEAILGDRLAKLCNTKSSEDSKVEFHTLGFKLPLNAKNLTDDALEIISVLLDFERKYSIKDILSFFHYMLGNEKNWNYYANERQQGFQLIIVEKILKILGEESGEISMIQLAHILRKTLQYIEKCPNGQLLQEDLSRIFLKISNTCGSSCLHQYELLNTDTLDSNLHAQNYTDILLIIGLSSLTKGIRIFHREERVKEFAPLFLEAIYLEHTTRNKYHPENPPIKQEYVEKGYKILYESWLGRPSHIESLQHQQLEGILDKIQKIKSPDNVAWLGFSLSEICSILSESYHGFYQFDIQAYEKNIEYLGDISVYSLPLTLGYELRVSSPLGKIDELSSLAHSHEIQMICKEISRYIQTSIRIFCGPEYLSIIHRFETEIPHESSNSIARWYKRIIEKEVTPIVYVQQKAKLLANPDGSSTPYSVVGGGVECLLRFYEHRYRKTFGPGPYPAEIGSMEFHEYGVFEAMNVLGVYTAFMFEHLNLIFAQMSEIDIPFSLNVRGDELTVSSYTTNIDLLCKQYSIAPERITIEILEEGLDLKNKQVILSIQHFLQKGIRISVDDFGSNQSSEARINGIREILTNAPSMGKFEIKLDAIYTEQLLTNFEYVKGLVSALKLTGASICCERIENETHLTQAFHAGIDTIQGYVFHKPEPVTDFIVRQKEEK